MNFIVITLLCHSNLGVLWKNHWKLIVIDNAMLCALLGGCPPRCIRCIEILVKEICQA